MKLLKLFTSIILFIIILFYFLVNYSSEITRYECNGNFIDKDKQNPARILMELQEFRWWVKLWKDSDGILLLGNPLKRWKIYEHLEEQENSIQIYEEANTDSVSGVYSKMNNKLLLKINAREFDGDCSVLF